MKEINVRGEAKVLIKLDGDDFKTEFEFDGEKFDLLTKNIVIIALIDVINMIEKKDVEEFKEYLVEE